MFQFSGQGNGWIMCLWGVHLQRRSAIISSYRIVVRNKDEDGNWSLYLRWLQLLGRCRGGAFAGRHLDRASFPHICVCQVMRSERNSQSSDQRWLLRGLHRRRRLFHARTTNPFAPQTEPLPSPKCVLAEVGWRTDSADETLHDGVCRRVPESIYFTFTCFYSTQHVNVQVEGRKSRRTAWLMTPPRANQRQESTNLERDEIGDVG